MTAVNRIQRTLTLRRAALALVAGAPLDAADHAALRGAAPDAWELLLLAERCALPLVAALRRERDVLDALSPEVRALLSAAELRETRHVLAARSVLLLVDPIAHALGIRATVIKGGIAATGESRLGVDLGDVDLRVGDGRAGELWEALHDAGWTAIRVGGTPGEIERLATSAHYVPLLPPGGGMRLEIHDAVNYGADPGQWTPAGERPLPGFRAISEPSAEESVSMIIRHDVVGHPERRGHLRDLALLAQPHRRLAAAGIDAVRAAFAGDPYAPELLTMLQQVVSASAGERPADPGEARRFVAQKYAMVLQLKPAGLPDLVGRWLQSLVPLERAPVRRMRYRRDLWEALRAPHPRSVVYFSPALRRVHDVAPVAIRVGRTAVFLARLALTVARGPLARWRASSLARPA